MSYDEAEAEREKLRIAAHYFRASGGTPVTDWKDDEISYKAIKPEKIEKIVDLVELFERTKLHKADAWQKDFCRRLEDAFFNRHEVATRAMVHAEGQLGKSVILAQVYPAWILGHDPHHRVALATYNVSRSQAHSSAVIALMNLPVYAKIFTNPGSRVKRNTSKERWKTAARLGVAADEKDRTVEAQDSFNPVGLQSGLTGSGFDCFPAETRVKTEVGNMSIGELFMLQYTPKVYAYNHLINRVELRRIEAVREKQAHELIEFRTKSGSHIRCTPNHRLFIDGEYRTADQIEVGSRLSRLRGSEGLRFEAVQQMSLRREAEDGRPDLHVVWECVSSSPIRRDQTPKERIYGNVLLGRLHSGSQRGQEREQVQNMQDADARHVRRASLLLKGLLAPSFEALALYEDLSGMLGEIQTEESSNCLLLSGLCQQIALSANGRQRQLALQDRHELREVVSGNEADHSRSGSQTMRRLPQTGEITIRNLARESGEAYQSRDTSHRPRSIFECGGKPRHALHNLSRESSQLEADSVVMVRRIRDISVPVYDLQVEGCSNFFAEEILSHNSLIIDDPYADQQEAFSEATRESLQNFWEYTVVSRLSIYANVFGMFHRYHVQDLAGYLLDKGIFDYWRYASIADGPYIHTETGQKFDDPLGRKPGELISPERRPLSHYAEAQKNPGIFQAMNQGRPTAEEGGFFKINLIKPITPAQAVERIRECAIVVRGWDNAATDEGGDWTAGVKLGMRKDKRTTIFHAEMVQESTESRYDTQVRIAEDDGRNVTVTIPRDPGSAGKDVASTTERKLEGYTVVVRGTSQNKQERARNFSHAVNSGMVEIVSDDDLPPEKKWVKRFIRALQEFPLSTFDDPVDAGSDAYNTADETISSGFVIKNFIPQKNLMLWPTFAARFPESGPNGTLQPCTKLPANFTIYVGVKITPDARMPNSAAIVARAPQNANLPDKLFLVAEYKEWTDDFYKCFTWIDKALHAYCRNPKGATVWLHPESESYKQTIWQKLQVPVAIFEGDEFAGLTELDWHMLQTKEASRFGLPDDTCFYGLIMDSKQMSDAVDEFGLVAFRQESLTWAYNEKKKPNGVGSVCECVRMVAYAFRTVAAPLTRGEKVEAALDPRLRVEAISVMPDGHDKDSLVTRRNIEIAKVAKELDKPVRGPHASKFARR